MELYKQRRKSPLSAHYRGRNQTTRPLCNLKHLEVVKPIPPDKPGGLNRLVQHSLIVYPPECQSPKSFVRNGPFVFSFVPRCHEPY